MGVSYQKITGQAEPLPDDILVVEMEQGQRLSRGGIILSDDTAYSSFDEKDAKAAKGIRARWAQVYKVGSNVDYVSAGEYVLVEHGRWTYAIDFIDENDEEVKVQKIDPAGILLMSDTEPLEIANIIK